jgi:2-amino-4-hydroxy-6-hydroxymethyldihydropteridine diphosphokinase
MDAPETVVFFSLGSNIEPRQTFLNQAVKMLRQTVQVTGVSSIYETEPWGYTDQEPFLNLVLSANTNLTANQLLDQIKHIECDLGRQPSFRYGPRQIDIDILIFGNEIIRSDTLVIPHPRLQERAFVLIPLLELAPNLVIPGINQTVEQASAPYIGSTSVRKI